MPELLSRGGRAGRVAWGSPDWIKDADLNSPSPVRPSLVECLTAALPGAPNVVTIKGRPWRTALNAGALSWCCHQLGSHAVSHCTLTHLQPCVLIRVFSTKLYVGC